MTFCVISQVSQVRPTTEVCISSGVFRSMLLIFYGLKSTCCPLIMKLFYSKDISYKTQYKTKIKRLPIHKEIIKNPINCRTILLKLNDHESFSSSGIIMNVYFFCFVILRGNYIYNSF